MAISVQTIAQALQLEPEDLIQRSLVTFLETERRAAHLDIADFQDRYGARSSAELRAKIASGQVYSHPAWEDAIEWETLEAYLRRISDWLDNPSA